ncbi:MAG: 3-dehydroquinate synthase [Bacteroidales bacterium]|nr:3-dehydroquinate synthase [Bacteroidales bacterium]
MSSLIKSNILDYPIFIGENIFPELENFLEKYSSKKIFILVDENTGKHCLPLLIARIKFLKSAKILKIKSGEKRKNIKICKTLWDKLIFSNADRNSLLINLGGGVITDLGGFTASTFKRGIGFIHLPTTLLSMVDASIGGKTAVNLDNIKNQIGIFGNPKAIFINPAFLITLDKRELISGYAEIIKHALICDKEYLKTLKSTGVKDADWNFIIKKSVEIKSKIVKLDPKENNIRKALNFGHTIGHAFESYSLENDKNPLLHGEAIAAGMICEAYLSAKILKLKEKELNEIISVISPVFRQYKNFEIKRLIELMHFDKKNVNKKINFTLIPEIGKYKIDNEIEENLISESLNFYKNLPQRR